MREVAEKMKKLATAQADARELILSARSNALQCPRDYKATGSSAEIVTTSEQHQT